MLYKENIPSFEEYQGHPSLSAHIFEVFGTCIVKKEGWLTVVSKNYQDLGKNILLITTTINQTFNQIILGLPLRSYYCLSTESTSQFH